jgi:broad specificity phosphatase PhoE
MIFQSIIAANLFLTPISHSLDEMPRLEPSDSQVTRIYVIRHGESAFNKPDANGVKMTSGKSLSIPLTETGESQASELAEKLSMKFPENAPIVLISSAAKRAQDTADRIFAELKQHHLIERGESDENLCELGQGIWEGKPKDAAYEKAMDAWKALSAKDKYTAPRISTGESYAEGGKRVLSSLRQIVDAHPNKSIVIVSHAAAMNALTLQLNLDGKALSETAASPLPGISVDNCDILLIELPKGEPIEKAKVAMSIASNV